MNTVPTGDIVGMVLVVAAFWCAGFIFSSLMMGRLSDRVSTLSDQNMKRFNSIVQLSSRIRDLQERLEGLHRSHCSKVGHKLKKLEEINKIQSAVQTALERTHELSNIAEIRDKRYERLARSVNRQVETVKSDVANVDKETREKLNSQVDRLDSIAKELNDINAVTVSQERRIIDLERETV